MARARWKIAEMNRYGLSSNCTQTAFIYAVRSNRNKNQSESEKAPQKSQGAAVASCYVERRLQCVEAGASTVALYQFLKKKRR